MDGDDDVVCMRHGSDISVDTEAGMGWVHKVKDDADRPKAGPKKEKAIFDSPEHFHRWVVGQTGWQANGVWYYLSADGKTKLMAVIRIDGPGEGEKEYTPLHPNKGGWSCGDPKGKMPLYNLPGIVDADPAAPVFICEGEKAALAGIKSGLCCTTSSHGANSVKRTDWLPLTGRWCVILPDNDPPDPKKEMTDGQAYARAVQKQLERL